MTLSAKQQVFTLNAAKLIVWAYQQGYGLTFGDAYRSMQQAAANAQAGIGIVHSLHTMRLAIDLNLFRGEMYYSATEAYRPLGDYWKSLDPLNCWGGDFAKPDGNHFSMTDGGIK